MQNVCWLSYEKRKLLTKTLVVVKLITILLFVACLQVSANGFSQITLSEKNASLEKLFNQVSKQSGYEFLYTTKMLQSAKTVDIKVKDATVEEVLAICFKNQPFTFTIIEKTIIVKPRPTGDITQSNGKSPFEEFFAPTDIAVRGTVVNEKGEGLPGATIIVKGTNKAKFDVTTGSNGGFSMIVPGSEAVLIVSYVGYKTKEVTVSGADVDLVITLELEVTKLLDVAVVSTGYQTLPKDRATGSFQIIDNELLNRTNGSSILSRLEGVTTGMLIDRRLNGDGKPRLSDVSIRGLSTLSVSLATPLVIVNNFPYEGDINNINPNDIENVTILKDAAAASIWGARAGNGVIVITTKKGVYSKPLSVTFNTGRTVMEKPDLFAVKQMSTSDFIDVETRLFNEGFYDNKIDDIFSWPYLSPVVELLNRARPGGSLTPAEANAQIDVLRKNDVRNDFLKHIYRKSTTQQYALCVDGGGNQFNYRVSAGYDKDLVDLVKNSNERFTTRTDLSFNPIKNLNLQSNIFYTQNKLSRFGRYHYSTGLIPYTRFADDAGNPLAVGTDIGVRFFENASPEYLDWQYRPLAELNSSSFITKTSEILFDLGAKYQISKVFSVDIKYQYGKNTSEERTLDDIGSYYTRNLINLATEFQPGQTILHIPLGGILKQTPGYFNINNFRGQLNVDKKWKNKHELNAIVGAEKKETHSRSNSSKVYGYDDELLTHKDVDNTLQILSPLYTYVSLGSEIDFTDQLYRSTSLYGNAAYSYKSRYTVSASTRKDAANLFGVNTNLRGAPFWSAGLGWDISKEPFYRSSKLPYLKLRTTYGYQGNTDNSLSAFSTLRYTGNDYYTGLPYAEIVNPANYDLRWEKIGTFNLGIDFRLKNNVLRGSIEYYARRSTDVLFHTPLDYTTGFSNSTFNSTALKAKGVDLTLHSNNLSKKSALKWNTDLIFSYMANKVTAFKPFLADYIYSGFGISAGQVVGKPATSVYSYEWAGLDPVTGDPQGFIDGQVSKDYNALLAVNSEKLRYHGSSTPIYSGALRNSFTYKGFDLSVNITAKLGHYFRRNSINYSQLFAGQGHSDYSDRWQKPGDELMTNVPSFQYPDDFQRSTFYERSAALVEKASHIRLQDIVFSYALNKPNWQIKNIRIFTNISNLGLIWKANKVGLDPDNYVGYPARRTVAFGLNTNF